MKIYRNCESTEQLRFITVPQTALKSGMCLLSLENQARNWIEAIILERKVENLPLKTAIALAKTLGVRVEEME